MSTGHAIAIAAVFLWIGFVCAISFMEAWLKFRAPGVTIPIGLGIGRLVFKALNRVEWALALVSVVCLYTAKHDLFSGKMLALYLPVVLLLIQTVLLLPGLDKRAELHIKGEPVPSSHGHFYFVAAETVKVISLFVFGALLFG